MDSATSIVYFSSIVFKGKCSLDAMFARNYSALENKNLCANYIKIGLISKKRIVIYIFYDCVHRHRHFNYFIRY